MHDNYGMQKALQIVPRQQRADVDTKAWLQRPMAERMAAVELLRQQWEGMQGSPDAEPRLQKVCRVSERRGR